MFETFEHYFPYKDTDKKIHVYLPENISDGGRAYPVLYMYDGHNLFMDEYATYGTSWGLLDFMATYDKQVIIVGIECSHEEGERLNEYCPYSITTPFFGEIEGYGKEYMDWLIHDLKPAIDEKYPTLPERETTAIGGSSMGGLMAFYSLIAYNDYISKAAALSPAIGFCVEELQAELGQHVLNSDSRVYFSFGQEEVNENRLEEVVYFNDALVDQGGESYIHIEEPGKHDEMTWRKQNQRYMDFLWK